MGYQPVYIDGYGETSRDFCFIDNAVQVRGWQIRPGKSLISEGIAGASPCSIVTSLPNCFKKGRLSEILVGGNDGGIH